MISRQGNNEKIENNRNKKTKNALKDFKRVLFAGLRKKISNTHSVNLTQGCLCSYYVDGSAMGMFLFLFCVGTACSTVMFAEVTFTAIS